MGNFSIGLTYSLLFLGLLLSIEYITRLKRVPKEISRRIAHILSGFFGALMAFVLEPWIFITFVFVFLLIISISYLIKFFSSIHGVKRKTYGEILLPIGILAAYLVAGGANTIYLVAVLILAIADPLAGFVGALKVDKKRILGSIAFFISALAIILILISGQQLASLFMIALIITIIERVSIYGTDNISIPLSASLLLKILF